jgi:predicted PurR-regulated permease PerM
MSILGYKQKHGVWIDPISVLLNVALLYCLFLMYQVRDVFTLLFLAFILMTALHPMVMFFNTRLRVPRGIAIFLSYISVVVLFGVIIGFVVPPVVNELYLLVKSSDIPYFQQFQQEIAALSLDLSEIGALAERVGTSVNMIFNIISSTFAGAFTFMTLLVFSAYMMIDRPHLHKKIAWFTKEKKYFDIAEKYINDLELQLGGWVRGQILLMVLIGGLTYVGLLLLNIPYALPLALLAGVLEIIPNLGPTVAAVPAIILAYVVGGPVLAGITTLFYFVMQQLENNLIVPKIMHDNADVNPLVAMVTIIIGLTLGGVIGALISVPMYIVFRTTYATIRRNSL